MKKFSITVAGGGSTFTPGIIMMLLDHRGEDSRSADCVCMTMIKTARRRLQKPVRFF